MSDSETNLPAVDPIERFRLETEANIAALGEAKQLQELNRTADVLQHVTHRHTIKPRFGGGNQGFRRRINDQAALQAKLTKAV